MHVRTTVELALAEPIPATMPTAVLGRSGLVVSVLGWGQPGLPDRGDANTRATADVYQQCGGNVLDTAASYGASEELIGRCLADRRRDFMVATKSHPVDADQTLRDLETSLQRMKADCVDLFYAPHGCWDEERLRNCFKKGGVIDGARKALERGLAKHLAFSFDYFQGLDLRRLRALIDTDVFEVVQLPYCLVQVEPVDQEIIPFARAKGMGIIANFPTLNGLTGREWGVFYRDFEGIVDTPGQATLLAILCHPQIDCVLTRFSSPARALENCFAGRRLAAMTSAEKEEIRRRVEAHGTVRYLQRNDCPPAPPEVRFRHGMIHFDLYTRFGFGGARAAVEAFARQLEACPQVAWDETTRAAVEQVRQSCPVMLTK